MDYDIHFWNKWTNENEAIVNDELSRFIHGLVLSLHVQKVLEVGCNVGNNLKHFPENFDVHGIDLNAYSLEKAREKRPSFKFTDGSILDIPLRDSEVDFVFTRSVLNYVPQNDMKKAIDELWRVSSKYIMNIEIYGEDGKEIQSTNQDNSWYRNMKKWWSEFDVKIISHVDMHEEIDPCKTRFTLIKKIK